MKKFKTLDDLWKSDTVLTSGSEDIRNRDGENLAQRLTAALSADLQPLGKALAAALQAEDGPAFTAALRKISERMPEFLESAELEAMLASEMVKALTTEDE